MAMISFASWNSPWQPSDHNSTNPVVSRQALILLAFLALIWGSTWPIMKIAVLAFEPWTFRAYCGVLGGLGMLLVLKLIGQRITLPTDQLRLALLVAPFSLGGWFVFSALGVGLMGSGRAAIIAYTMPLWAIVFARLILQEPITPARTAGLLAGLAGLGVLLSHDFTRISDQPLGIVYMLCAAIVWGLGTVLFKRATWREPVAVIVAWQLLGLGLPVTFIALLTETPLPDADSMAWLALAFNIVFSTVVGYVLWNRIVLLMPAGVAAIASLVVPVTGVLMGAMLLHEAVGWREMTALGLVLGAILLVMKEQPRLKGTSI